MTFVVGGTKTSGVYDVTYVREFRYDGPRQRYLNRMYDDEEYELDDSLVLVSEVWSDYAGDSIYGDYTLSGQTPTNKRSYQPGIGKFDWTTSTLKHYHTDMIGTARMMTDSGGAGTAAGTFTAFGQQVGGTAQRYGYAGAHGYQTDDTGQFPFLHVGARYYNPATGRFLQRDPIGISGGLNVYGYVRNDPVRRVDPDGLYPHGGFPNYQPPPPTGKPKPPPQPSPPRPRPPTPAQELADINLTLQRGAAVLGIVAICVSGPPGWALGMSALLVGSGSLIYP